jgi:hypothetical protein
MRSHRLKNTTLKSKQRKCLRALSGGGKCRIIDKNRVNRKDLFANPKLGTGRSTDLI